MTNTGSILVGTVGQGIMMSRDDKALFRLQNGFPWSYVRAVAGSCLTQAPARKPKPKKKTSRGK